LPPAAAGGPPLLAIASWDHVSQEPLLFLYNANSGEQVRQLKGHVEPIRCLAFSPDGRLLASVADDQTVSIWSLTNLDKILGKHGMVIGLAVKDDERTRSIVVRKVPAKSKLAEDDVIEGVVVDRRFDALANARKFYDAVFGMKPGDTIRLRIKGKGVVA